MSRSTPPVPTLGAALRRGVRLHRRLAIAVGVAIAIVLFAPMLSFRTRLLVGWDVGIALWLILTLHMVNGSNAAKIRARAAEEDEGAAAILIGCLLASFSSLVAVVMEAGATAHASGAAAAHILLAIGTLALSWCFIHGIYALHYAREYYAPDVDCHPMLGFPGSQEPDAWDFMYFSFTIGTSAQTADVSVNSARMRRFVLGHQLVAYAFNASVLALGVNVAAGLV